MVDIFTASKRSEIMSLIRGQGNKNTELAMVDLFKKNHILGWRRNQKIFGSPDFVFKSKNILIFVDGCFWHGCPYHGTMPKSNRIFWKNKILNNIKRDKKVTKYLKKTGWKVFRIWEHQLENLESRQKLTNKILILLK